MLTNIGSIEMTARMSMSELRYVRPNEYVTDFRTPITGITPATFYREGVISEDEAGRFW